MDKGELMRAVWPDVFVEEGNLSQYVFLLRKVLGTRPEGGTYIETIPRRGYRFVPTVTRGRDAPQGASAHSPVGRIWWKWATGGLLSLALLAGLWSNRPPAQVDFGESLDTDLGPGPSAE